MDTEEARKALCLQLAMLDRMMKLHAWATFGDKESEDLDKSAPQIESEACGSISTQSKEK